MPPPAQEAAPAAHEMPPPAAKQAAPPAAQEMPPHAQKAVPAAKQAHTTNPTPAEKAAPAEQTRASAAKQAVPLPAKQTRASAAKQAATAKQAPKKAVLKPHRGGSRRSGRISGGLSSGGSRGSSGSESGAGRRSGEFMECEHCARCQTTHTNLQCPDHLLLAKCDHRSSIKPAVFSSNSFSSSECDSLYA